MAGELGELGGDLVGHSNGTACARLRKTNFLSSTLSCAISLTEGAMMRFLVPFVSLALPAYGLVVLEELQAIPHGWVPDSQAVHPNTPMRLHAALYALHSGEDTLWLTASSGNTRISINSKLSSPSSRRRAVHNMENTKIWLAIGECSPLQTSRPAK